MKKSSFLTSLIAASLCAILPSCGLLQSAGRLPGSVLKMVGRTAGMNVNHVEESTPEKPEVEIVGDGVIEQLD